MRHVLDEALSKIPNGDLASIRYEKPRDEVEKLKAFLKVKSAKKVGEITYEEYLRQNNLNL